MPRRKALKVVVDVQFHAITCPGVFLAEQQDVFLNVELLGQRRRTKSVPPVFPFLFHEKLRFDKVFSHATDPIQIANALEGETLRIELVQLTYPGGDLLATYEDSAREFLFPTPRISPTYPGVDREVLLQRSYSFPGIAPKLEFSSRTIIKEVTSVSSHSSSSKKREKKQHRSSIAREDSVQPNSYSTLEHPVEASTPHSTSRPSSNKKNVKCSTRQGRTRSSSLCQRAVSASSRGYQQSTISSRARSPSPYTRRRMAQLSMNDPFESTISARPYKTELEERPEFVIRKAAEDSLAKPAPPLPAVTPSPVRTTSPRSKSPTRRRQTPGRPKRLSTNDDDYCTERHGSEDTDEIIDNSLLRQRLRSPISSRPSSARSAPESTPRPLTPKRDLSFSDADLVKNGSRFSNSKLTPSSILFRTSLRDRFTANESPYEKIRDRVRGLLTSPRATQIVNASVKDADEKYWRRRSQSPSPRSAHDNPSNRNRVYLGNGEYWDKMADENPSQPRREVLEESIDQIYDDIYNKVKRVSA